MHSRYKGFAVAGIRQLLQTVEHLIQEAVCTADTETLVFLWLQQLHAYLVSVPRKQGYLVSWLHQAPRNPTTTLLETISIFLCIHALLCARYLT